MALKLTYYGQNDGTTTPYKDKSGAVVTLTGDPGTDQATLTAAGFLGGILVKLVALADGINPGISPAQPGDVPFGTLLNGPGEFAGAIGPSGSKKAPVVRAMWQGNVNSEAYVATPTAAYAVGQYLYVGTNGMYTSDKPATGNQNPVGINTHVPSTDEPWLGVASLI